jgi:hypothetical protein
MLAPGVFMADAAKAMHHIIWPEKKNSGAERQAACEFGENLVNFFGQGTFADFVESDGYFCIADWGRPMNP